MDKLRLSLGELRVETFRTDTEAAACGTVNANAITFNTGCNTCYCTSRINACFCTENATCRCQ
jgi:hypothetical protein